MGAAYLEVIDFDGLSMTGTDFEGHFLIDFDITSQFPLEAVLSEAPANFPSFVRGDPQDRVIPLLTLINPAAASTQALIDALKSVFSPSRDEAYLRVRDDDGNRRRMLVKSLGLTPWEEHSDNAYVASLQAAEPVWEGDSLASGTDNVTASPQSWVVNNIGNERTYPQITIDPQTLKGHGNHYIRRWPLTIAWRSELDGVDSQGLPYPIDVVDRSLDTATEVVAGRMQADGDDLRVFVDGVEQDRYLDAINTAATAVWTSIAFQPMKVATLAANMTAGNPANGGSIDVSNPEGTAGFPESGILLIGTEAITYSGLTDTSFEDVRRGQRGTAAAGHTAADLIYWVEHDILLVSDYTAAANPPADSDREPIIDLTPSQNTEHHYLTTEGLIEPDTLRTGQWRREQRRTDYLAQALQLYQSAGIIHVEDTAPEAGRPNYDSLALYAPCYITSTGTDAITVDYQVEHDMLFDLVGVDAEGFESLLRRRDIRGEGAPVYYYVGSPAYHNAVALSPADPLAGLILHGINARLCGGEAGRNNELSIGDLNNEVGQSFRLDGPSPIRMYRIRIRETVAGCDKGLRSKLSTLVAGPVDLMGPSSLVPNAQFSTTRRDMTMFMHDDPATTEQRNVELPAGAYIIHVNEEGGSVEGLMIGTGQGGSNPRSHYARGSVWVEVATVWAQSAGQDADFAVCSDGMAPQTDAQVGTGKDVQFRNVIVKFVPTKTPAIVIGSAQELYFVDATLENVTTGQQLEISYPMQFGISAQLVIDCALHTVLYPLLAAAHDVSIPGAVEPSDLQEWLRLDPGNNTLRWTEPTIGAGAVDVTTSWRPRWT